VRKSWLVAKSAWHTSGSTVFSRGSVSTGFMHATPGDMKSFRSSAESIALIVGVGRTLTRRGKVDLVSSPNYGPNINNWRKMERLLVIYKIGGSV
jgi:hypothetical protein